MPRLEVLKTYKIFIAGKFPRTESGRYYIAENKKGDKLANVCLSSRKDFRDAVIAARSAFNDWGSRAAFNRSQVLYRIAEMLEGRKAQFIDELMKQDSTKEQAEGIKPDIADERATVTSMQPALRAAESDLNKHLDNGNAPDKKAKGKKSDTVGDSKQDDEWKNDNQLHDALNVLKAMRLSKQS